jgi:uncharacterized repeat protein (TIGR03803 family)
MRFQISSQTLAQPTTKLSALAILVLTMSALAMAQQETTIHTFKSGLDGANPSASLITDSAGNLYGTTAAGGGSINCGARSPHHATGCGTVFELTPQGDGQWSYTILYAFQGSSTDGATPYTPLVLDAAGNLYGTTYFGGASNLGVIFELSPPGSGGGPWTESVLYSFVNGNPSSGLVFDAQGNLYGEGGAPNADGQIFQLSPPAVAGGSWTFNALFTFPEDGTLGAEPIGGLVVDAGGNLYGGAGLGGGAGPGCPGEVNCGLIFEVVRPTTAGGAWGQKVLHYFTGSDGADPLGGVVFHNGNHLYGTTSDGGDDIGDGTVFELSPAAGGDWTETLLFKFNRYADTGFRPSTGVVFDSQGNLFSTTYFAPVGGSGVFEVSPGAAHSDSWTFSNLYDVNCTCYGISSLTFDKANVLYGTSVYAGSDGFGVVFAIIP